MGRGKQVHVVRVPEPQLLGSQGASSICFCCGLFWHSILMHFSLGVDSGLRHLASMLPCLPPLPGTVPWSVDSWLASTCWRAWAIPAVLLLFHLGGEAGERSSAGT